MQSNEIGIASGSSPLPPFNSKDDVFSSLAQPQKISKNNSLVLQHNNSGLNDANSGHKTPTSMKKSDSNNFRSGYKSTHSTNSSGGKGMSRALSGTPSSKIEEMAEIDKVSYDDILLQASLHFFVSFSIIQITRVTIKFNPSSMFPLYGSFIPYLFFHIMAREAHTVLSALWFITIMSINLQLGQISKKSQIFVAVFIYICVYAALVILESLTVNSLSNQGYFIPFQQSAWLFANNCGIIDNAHPRHQNNVLSGLCYYSKSTFNIEVFIELTYGSSIFLFCSALVRLQTFIQEYAISLLDRKNNVRNLSKINHDLKVQLKKLKVDVNLDLDSPITKVIKVIRGIQESNIDAELMDSLDHVIEILSSNQLFLPNFLKDGNVDSEVNNWLNAMVLNPNIHPVKTTPSVINLDGFELKEIIVKDIELNSDQINGVLKKCDSWNFDIFELVKVSNGRPVYFLGMHLFEKYGFSEKYQIEDSVVKRFFLTIEDGYKPNPYHNSTHAADVMHAMHYFLKILGLSELLGVDDIFSALIAALIHDFNHPGKTNAFLINASDELSILYNDNAVLEHFHCAKAFELILGENTYAHNHQTGLNIFANLSKDKFKQVRSTIIQMVLATDMAGHFETLAKFKNKINSANGIDFRDVKDRQLVLDIAIKCGDINNASRPIEVYTKWVECIMDEFWNQGDEEKRRGIPISMFMDRNNCAVHKCQIGFIDYIVNPLYEVWESFVVEGEEEFPPTINLAKNREYWKNKQDEAENKS